MKRVGDVEDLAPGCTATPWAASVEIAYEGGYPVVVDSSEETAFATSLAEGLVGTDNVSTCPLLLGSEDFADFLENGTGCFLRLGNGTGSGILHSATYDFDDDSLGAGAAPWARLAEKYLQR